MNFKGEKDKSQKLLNQNQAWVGFGLFFLLSIVTRWGLERHFTEFVGVIFN